MASQAIWHAAQYPDSHVLVVAADHQHKRELKRFFEQFYNIHVCARFDIDAESRNGYDIVFWDHYAAECELAKALALYDHRLTEPTIIDNTDYSEE